jgi:hypothetical protein
MWEVSDHECKLVSGFERQCMRVNFSVRVNDWIWMCVYLCECVWGSECELKRDYDYELKVWGCVTMWQMVHEHEHECVNEWLSICVWLCLWECECKCVCLCDSVSGSTWGCGTVKACDWMFRGWCVCWMRGECVSGIVCEGVGGWDWHSVGVWERLTVSVNVSLCESVA